MALEDLTGPNKFITALVPTNPTPSDPLSEGAFHIEGIKNVLLNSFPAIDGPVTATAAQWNQAIQLALNAAQLGAAATFEVVSIGETGVGGSLNLKRPSDGANAWEYGMSGGDTFLYDYSAGTVAWIARAGGYFEFLRTIELKPSGTALGTFDAPTSAQNYFTWKLNGTVIGYFGTDGGGAVSGGTGNGIALRASGPVQLLANDGATIAILSGGRLDAPVFNATAAGITRTNTGFRSIGSTVDVGKAPGIFRGTGIANANGDFQFNFGFSMTGTPIITANVYSPATPAVATVQDFGQNYAIIRAAVWNGSTWIPADGYRIFCTVCDESLAPA